MDSRVSMQTIVQNALANTRRLSAQLASIQAQAGTGKRYAQVSDNPSAVLSVLTSETQVQNFATHLDNITTATSNLNSSASTLQQVSDIFSQARSLAVEAGNSGNDASANEALAKQVDALLDNLLGLANSQNGKAYLFGGTARTQPFVVTSLDANGHPAAVQYRGGADGASMFVDHAQQVAINYAGDAVFRAQSRQPTVITGTTGASPGGGTDNATGRGALLVQHSSTTFAPGSGVQAGVNSAAGDTILGPAGTHRLHITDTSGTGAAGTISLDGGAVVAFTNGDTNLRVTNAAGDAVYLDTTAITANFDGDINLTADGTMSIDGGATNVALTFAPDQSVLNSVTGKVTFIESTGIQRTGTDDVNYPGTYDAFQALIALRDDLRNTRGLSQHDQIVSISANLSELERAHTGVLQTLGIQSASLQGLQSLQNHLQDLQLNAKNNASQLGDIDITEVVLQLQNYQNLLQLSLASFSRIAGQSLLDFLK